MRTKYVETYQTPAGLWMAELMDQVRPVHAPGATELEALGALCDRLYDYAIEQAGFPEEWP